MIASDETFIEAIARAHPEGPRQRRVGPGGSHPGARRPLRGGGLRGDARARGRHRTTSPARSRGSSAAATRLRPLDLPRGSILVADELSPVDASRLDPRRVRALALERGGPTSHATIIARSFGLPGGRRHPGPLRRGLAGPADRRRRRPGHRRPEPLQGAAAPEPRCASARRARRRGGCAAADRAGRAATRDGVRIAVRANLELAEEIPALERYHAEGVGLFRSEFLYLKAAPEPPGIEEQRAVYESPARGGRAASRRRAHVRPRRREGDRARRGREPGSRAAGHALLPGPPGALRRAADGAVPRLAEGTAVDPPPDGHLALRARRPRAGALERAVERAGLAEPPPLGIMIEIPSAALLAERFAPEADFFSIGTNDLAQYGLAVDRANPDVASLYQPLHPAILRMISFVVDAGRARGRPVAVCGELAADPIGSRSLVGLGIRDLSVTPVAIAGVKESLVGDRLGRGRGLWRSELSTPAKPPRSRRFSEDERENRAQALGPRADLRRERALRREDPAPGAGHSLSLQYHERKDETFLRSGGRGEPARGRRTGVMEESDLKPGAAPTASGPGVQHRMRADRLCDLVEVSSPELDDVVRLEDAYGARGNDGAVILHAVCGLRIGVAASRLIPRRRRVAATPTPTPRAAAFRRLRPRREPRRPRRPAAGGQSLADVVRSAQDARGQSPERGTVTINNQSLVTDPDKGRVSTTQVVPARLASPAPAAGARGRDERPAGVRHEGRGLRRREARRPSGARGRPGGA